MESWIDRIACSFRIFLKLRKNHSCTITKSRRGRFCDSNHRLIFVCNDLVIAVGNKRYERLSTALAVARRTTLAATKRFIRVVIAQH
jgi:hypothetical protein